MDTENMIREVRNVADRYRDKYIPTFEINIYDMCVDVANRLEKLDKEIKDLKNENKILKDKLKHYEEQ